MSARRTELILFLAIGACLGLAALLAIALQNAGMSSRQAGALSLLVAMPVCWFGAPWLSRLLRRRSSPERRDELTSAPETPEDVPPSHTL
jgi:hypothetical protein